MPKKLSLSKNDNLYDSISNMDTDYPPNKKSGWGLASVFGKAKIQMGGSTHGDTTNSTTNSHRSSSHGITVGSSNNNYTNNSSINHDSEIEGSFWNKLEDAKPFESDTEDAGESPHYKVTARPSMAWGLLGGGMMAQDESDYDTDAGAGEDDWNKSNLLGSNGESDRQQHRAMNNLLPPHEPLPPRNQQSSHHRKPAPLLDMDDSAYIEAMQDDSDRNDGADSLADPNTSTDQEEDETGFGLGAFLDKGKESAMEQELAALQNANGIPAEDQSVADGSVISSALDPQQQQRLLAKRMELYSSANKSVCTMSLNPEEAETKERRPWRQQKHLRRGSALGAMPQTQQRMLDSNDDEDDEEEDLFKTMQTMTTAIIDDRPVTGSNFDDMWGDGNATVATEMPSIAPSMANTYHPGEPQPSKKSSLLGQQLERVAQKKQPQPPPPPNTSLFDSDPFAQTTPTKNVRQKQPDTVKKQQKHHLETIDGSAHSSNQSSRRRKGDGNKESLEQPSKRSSSVLREKDKDDTTRTKSRSKSTSQSRRKSSRDGTSSSRHEKPPTPLESSRRSHRSEKKDVDDRRKPSRRLTESSSSPRSSESKEDTRSSRHRRKESSGDPDRQRRRSSPRGSESKEDGRHRHKESSGDPDRQRRRSRHGKTDEDKNKEDDNEEAKDEGKKSTVKPWRQPHRKEEEKQSSKNPIKSSEPSALDILEARSRAAAEQSKKDSFVRENSKQGSTGSTAETHGSSGLEDVTDPAATKTRSSSKVKRPRSKILSALGLKDAKQSQLDENEAVNVRLVSKSSDDDDGKQDRHRRRKGDDHKKISTTDRSSKRDDTKANKDDRKERKRRSSSVPKPSSSDPKSSERRDRRSNSVPRDTRAPKEGESKSRKESSSRRREESSNNPRRRAKSAVVADEGGDKKKSSSSSSSRRRTSEGEGLKSGTTRERGEDDKKRRSKSRK